MTPMRPGQIRGVWGTLLVPWTAAETIDHARLEHQLEVLLTAGVQGVYTHGTAGEFHALTETEVDQVNLLVASACERAGIPFQLGASHPVAQTSLARVSRARELAPGAIQVILPDWLPLSEIEVLEFVSRVAEVADPVPLVLYNPPHAKTRLSPAQLGTLRARVPAVAGVKVAGGDDTWYAQMREHLTGCSVFVPGHLLASGVHHGASGSYSNIAAMSPRGAVAWSDLMQTELDAALDVERRIGLFFERHIAPMQAAGLSNPALDKFLAGVGGWAEVGLQVRWPYRSASAEALEGARREAREMVPELFDDG